MSDIKREIATADTETDPFKIGRTVIEPFSWGIYSETTGYVYFWGDDATEQFIEFLADADTPPLEIYAHNGGRFDWLFLSKFFDPDIMFIGNRIAKVTILGGKYELRDSYANMPVPLKSFNTASGEKLDIDYAKLERRCRVRYKNEILKYLERDVMVLYDAILLWQDMFTNKPLTMASAATKQLRKSIKKTHGVDIEKLTESQDSFWRQFYYGGRVECFEKGELKPSPGKKWRVYDINSAYPATMKNDLHPIGNNYITSRRITEHTDFAKILADSQGALPLRDEKGQITFPRGTYTFYATGHEIRTALSLGLLKIKTVFAAYSCDTRISFAEFIDHFYMLRLQAKENCHEMYVLFYKLVMNSSYGKTAIDPRKFSENMHHVTGYIPHEYTLEQEELAAMTPEEREAALPYKWRIAEILPSGFTIWERNVNTKGRFLNVACGASITGGARANMLRGLAASERPVYCDTDSIVCEEFKGDVHASRLGAWDFEKEGDYFALAGKKLYALFNDGQCVKKACKGSDLTPAQIQDVARGQVVVWQSEAPVMSLSGIMPLHRTIRNTAKITPGTPKTGDRFKRVCL